MFGEVPIRTHSPHVDFRHAISLNYIFFGIFFAVLAFFSVSLIHLNHVNDVFAKLFFISEAILQIAIEVFFLILLFDLVRNKSPLALIWTCAFASFILILHITDFFLIRLMDLSVWLGLSLLFEESFDNLVSILMETSFKAYHWILCIVILLLILVGGVLLYKISDKISKKKIFRLPYRIVYILIAACIVILLANSYIASRMIMPSVYLELTKTLPWKSTLYDNKQMLPVPSPMNDSHDLKLTTPLELKHKPAIYIFVAESLREDYLTENVSPHLHRFRTENIAFKNAFSNANATHLSWFSIFYSQLPFYWSNKKTSANSSGSPNLNAFNDAGYKINVYSTVNLKFYQTGRMLFGDSMKLMEHLSSFYEKDAMQVHEKDAAAMESLFEDIRKHKLDQGTISLIFLNSTHFPYSWPEDIHADFSPFVDSINFAKLACSTHDLDKIKNRYRNAIHYTDDLFGKFINELQKAGLYEDAVIVFTSDHGEEFYENGHIFHASNLSFPQTNVPIYYKFGSTSPGISTTSLQSSMLTSHIDIFPTLFHYLSGDPRHETLYDGESIFKPTRKPFVFSGRYNRGSTPIEFSINHETARTKMIAQFENKTDIFKSKAIQVNAITNFQDELAPLPRNSQDLFKECMELTFRPA